MNACVASLKAYTFALIKFSCVVVVLMAVFANVFLVRSRILGD